MTVPDTAETVVRASHIFGARQGEWRYQSYAELPDDGNRYEVLRGVLFMAPAPNTFHESISALIVGRLVMAISDKNVGRVLISPDIDAIGSVVRPDAVVVLNANLGVIARSSLVGPPDLVVEVASPATAAYDRDAVSGKRAIYAEIGVPEYWVVDPGTRTIEVLTLAGGAYTTLGVASGAASGPSRVLPEPTFAAARCFPAE